MRIYNGGGFRFSVNHLHATGIYDLLIRYESYEYTWQDVGITIINKDYDNNLQFKCLNQVDHDRVLHTSVSLEKSLSLEKCMFKN